MTSAKKINIAIDGHSSCGKGTLARYLAASLGYIFVDSGAMYRAVTYYLLRNQISTSDITEVQAILPLLNIGFIPNPLTQRNDVILNGENIEKEIRTMEVAAEVSNVAKIPAVRRFLVAWQKNAGKEKGIVMDGRDIGTVVFPDADLKIFMTARPEIRATRRFSELERAGVQTTYEDVLHNLQERDRIDSSREDSPLTLRSDYRVLDNSDLSIDQQNILALSWAIEILNGANRVG